MSDFSYDPMVNASREVFIFEICKCKGCFAP